MDKSITVFEYGYLADEANKKESKRINWISSAAFKYLKQLCLCTESESSFIRLKMIDSTEVLQTQNYAGMILTPDGTQIEILPKIGKATYQQQNTAAEEQSRESLLVMLACLGDFRHLKTETADIKQRKMPLLEVFISQFLSSVNHLIKRGIRSDYTLREDNLLFLKGKLQVGKQLKHNLINKHKFHVEFEEFLADRPENRIIHSALHCVKKLSRSMANQRLQQELAFTFADIPVSKDHHQDFQRQRIDRGMTHYETPLAWSKLILNAFSPLTMKGSHSATSLLFPMEAVFESYVAFQLHLFVNTGYQVKSQISSSKLVKHVDKDWFQLKPDLLIHDAGKSVCVLDTKWKTLDVSKANGTDKYGLSQADIYQMFAYGHNYLSGEGDMFLIFPYQNNFDCPVIEPFIFTDINGKETNLRLWLVPFQILPTKGKLMLSPKADSSPMNTIYTADVFYRNR
ncbi:MULTISPECIES: McrC family protein [unclassified Shewanella]|uniref:McrC family protein n=1 Tax=unclassified Shewanella TaxID=196818 RepID=UPI0021DA72E2|nr:MULTISPECIES: McrC family protein [unclassified Shewanella]MCU8023474.1 McrC family protein [Shewanella sp. SM78]MCU8080511.1 McrC family protein [Shewanella sp. SM103]